MRGEDEVIATHCSLVVESGTGLELGRLRDLTAHLNGADVEGTWLGGGVVLESAGLLLLLQFFLVGF